MNKINNKIKINNKEWLSKTDLYNIEAACIFAQVDIVTYLQRDNFSLYPNFYLTHSKAQKYHEIINTWYYGLFKLVHALPFWYINEAIKQGLCEMPKALLNEVKKFYERLLTEDQTKFLKDYPYITHKLHLSNNHRLFSNSLNNSIRHLALI